MFRLGGYGSKHGYPALVKELGADLASKVWSAQADPQELVRATQIMIDKGHLPAKDEQLAPPQCFDPTARVKRMQWEWGIGIDCACYTRHAISAATGRSEQSLHIGMPRTKAEIGKTDPAMRQLDHNAGFVRVSVAEVRPGDVITLDPARGERVGHNVIVRDRAELDGATRRRLVAGAADGAARAFLDGAGPFHVIQVDSSWGAGADGSPTGGYRRETWLFDESSKRWGYVDPQGWFRAPDTSGPSYTDDFHGAYRVKGT